MGRALRYPSSCGSSEEKGTLCCVGCFLPCHGSGVRGTWRWSSHDVREFKAKVIIAQGLAMAPDMKEIAWHGLSMVDNGLAKERAFAESVPDSFGHLNVINGTDQKSGRVDDCFCDAAEARSDFMVLHLF